MIKAAPPFSPAKYGNFQIFPNPTAEPIVAKSAPNVDEKPPRGAGTDEVFADTFWSTFMIILSFLWGWYFGPFCYNSLNDERQPKHGQKTGNQGALSDIS